MGMPVARLNDIDSGHGCFSPRPNNAASSNVFVNGRPVHRRGDGWNVHCCKSCHTGVTSGGSGTVFVNGRPIARVTDAVSCGGVIMTGSANVFSG